MSAIAWLEDDTIDFRDIVRPLERAGHSVFVYRTCKEALDGLERIQKSDLLLVDLFLPTGDASRPNRDPAAGLRLLAELRKKGVFAPAVVLSAKRKLPVHVPLCSALDVRDWLQKPISRYVMKSRIEAVLTSSPVRGGAGRGATTP